MSLQLYHNLFSLSLCSCSCRYSGVRGIATKELSGMLRWVYNCIITCSPSVCVPVAVVTQGVRGIATKELSGMLRWVYNCYTCIIICFPSVCVLVAVFTQGVRGIATKDMQHGLLSGMLRWVYNSIVLYLYHNLFSLCLCSRSCLYSGGEKDRY